MMPIMMIKEIPFPIPLSVIRSPSHMTNMEPAVRMMVELSVKSVPPPPAKAVSGNW